jgi:ATP/maltotriose-dependent transcriptional regulator MalT
MHKFPRKNIELKQKEIQRKDLIRLLNHTQVKLIVLSAGYGYGKTTLIEQWIKKDEVKAKFRNVYYFSIPEKNTDSLNLVRLLKEHTPGLNSTKKKMRDFLFDTDFEQAINEYVDHFNKIGQPILFIFDNFQNLSFRAVQLIERMIYLLEPVNQIVISTYESAAPPVFSEMLAVGQAVVLDSIALRFTPEEIKPLLGENQVVASLDGWEIAIQLARYGTSDPQKFELLVNWVLNQINPDLRQILREMSVSETWSDAEARLLGVELIPNWIKLAQHFGLPIRQINGWQFRLHEQIRLQLLSELRQQPKMYVLRSKILAQQLEIQGKLHNATLAFLEAQEFDEALRLAEILSKNYLNTREFHLLKNLMDNFNPIKLTPQLRESLGIALIRTSEQQKGLYFLNNLTAQNNLKTPTLIAMAEVYLSQGDIENANFRFNQATFDVKSSMDELTIQRFSVSLDMRMGQYEKAAKRIPNLLTLAEALGNPFEYGECLSIAAAVYFFLGHLEISTDILQKQIMFYELYGLPNSIIQIHTNLGLNLAFLNHCESALWHTQKAVELAKAWSNTLQIRTLINLALVQMLGRDFQSALQTVEHSLIQLESLQAQPNEQAEIWIYAFFLAGRLQLQDLKTKAQHHIEIYLPKCHEGRRLHSISCTVPVIFAQIHLKLLEVQNGKTPLSKIPREQTHHQALQI